MAIGSDRDGRRAAAAWRRRRRRRSSRPSTSPSASAAWSRSTTCRSPSRGGRSCRSSGRTARARRRSSTSSPGCTSRRRGIIAFEGENITRRRPDQITDARRRAHVPEHPPVRDDDRRRERDGRLPRADEGRPVPVDHPAPDDLARGVEDPPAGARDARVRRAPAARVRRDLGQPLLRRPAPRRDRPRAGVGAAAAAARRADRGHEPAGVRPAQGLHDPPARRARR